MQMHSLADNVLMKSLAICWLSQTIEFKSKNLLRRISTFMTKIHWFGDNKKNTDFCLILCSV